MWLSRFFLAALGLVLLMGEAPATAQAIVSDIRLRQIGEDMS